MDAGANHPVPELLCPESASSLQEGQQKGEEEEERAINVNDDAFNEIIRISCKRRGCCHPIKDDELVRFMVKSETALGFGTDQSLMLNGNRVKCARREAISWILKTREMFGFGFHTAYLSVTYFDRFLSKRSIDSEKSWAFKLLTVACVSLAAKMEEIRAPGLGEYQGEEYNFGPDLIGKMECLVLNTFGWKMMSISPFDFLPYFIFKLYEDPPPYGISSRIFGFMLSLMREVNLMIHRPSAIAAAVTMVASDQSLTRHALECKVNPIICSGFPDIEDVFRCYELMRKLGMENLKAPIGVKSPDISPNRLRLMDISDDSLVTSSTRTKRRRLEFGSPDQDQGQSDQKQQQ